MVDLDDLDRRIIDLLKRDGRESNREIARQLEVSEGTIRARIKRLEQEQVIRIKAVADASALGRMGSFAYIGISVDGGAARKVAEALTTIPEIAFVAIVLGRYDVLAFATTESRQQLVELVMERVGTLPGVRRTETTEGFDVLKHAYHWVRITD